MTEHIHVAPVPVGGRLLTPVTFTCGVLILAALAIPRGALRLRPGRGDHLNDGYPWGIWVVADVGDRPSRLRLRRLLVAMLVYIFNKGEYHPLVRRPCSPACSATPSPASAA